jgi:hypothetical protein
MSTSQPPEPRKFRDLIKSLLIETALYGGLVVGYFFLVLHFLSGGLYRLFERERLTYAWVALLLVVVQGFVLEELTRLLLGFIAPREKTK